MYHVNIYWICYSYRLQPKSWAFRFLFCASFFSDSPFGYLGEVTEICLAADCVFFGGDLAIFEANIYSYLEIAVSHGQQGAPLTSC